MHVLDAGLVQHIELLLVELGLFRRDLAFLLQLDEDVVGLRGFHAGLLIKFGLGGVNHLLVLFEFSFSSLNSNYK